MNASERAGVRLAREQQLVEQLQRAVELHLNPAGRLLYGAPRVVGAPALHERETQHTEASELVHAESASDAAASYAEKRRHDIHEYYVHSRSGTGWY